MIGGNHFKDLDGTALIYHNNYTFLFVHLVSIRSGGFWVYSYGNGGNLFTDSFQITYDCTTYNCSPFYALNIFEET